MLNEKQTDSVGWKKRLEDLDSLPGEDPAGSYAAWEKLYNRLHQEPRHKKTAWYWAAAGLLLVTAVPFLTKKNSTPPRLKEMVQEKPLTVPVANGLAIEHSVPVITSLPVVKKTARPFTAKRTAHSIINDTVNQQEALFVTVLQTNNLNHQTVVDSSGKTLALVVPVKKKLPVVHINELGKQEQENAKFASHNPWPSLQIKFLNQDNSSGEAAPAGSTTQDMLKIKIPLKN